MRKVFLACILLATVVAGAEELTVGSILTMFKAGAPADGIVAMINNPASTIAMSAADLATLRSAGVPEAVVLAVQARLPAPAPTPAPVSPDDARLGDVVRLTKSGLSEPIVANQIKQSGQAYNLTINDLIYLKNNGVWESIIGALMATAKPGGVTAALRAEAPSLAGPAAAAVPGELVFDGLVLQRATFLLKDRPGRLLLKGDTLSWVDGADPRRNFDFQLNGLEKLWLTCQARTPEGFCHRLSFQIVKGASYRFEDINRDSGSNAAILQVMEALRTYHPTLPFGPPDVKD
ncbi:MAG TPA: hypothetical protein PLS53_00725 [Thermoanaerobaculaceae bacterium]|nr:hypothetical protein [Thermoanaerobaculaceae bacterium]HPS76659.1 hypothetical protein [Thermoanaerobaculaceae bacterium]